jgi:hypothetical protein
MRMRMSRRPRALPRLLLTSMARLSEKTDRLREEIMNDMKVEEKVQVVLDFNIKITYK